MLKRFYIFITRFKDGYMLKDKVKIFLHNFLFLLLYPINRVSFIIAKKLIVHPSLFFSGFIVKNSDGLFFCKDNVNLDIISERFESNLRKYFKSINKGMFLDIGANVGKYTVMISNQIRKEGMVVSIEPHPKNFDILIKNMKLNKCENVIPIKVAAWNKKEPLKLFSHENQPVLASSVKVSNNYIKVNADTVDNIAEELKIKNFDFIKIDVEGAEPQVLEGMENVLKEGNAKIIFEAWDEEHVKKCEAILEKYNYEIENIDKLYWIAYKKTL